jgi:Asp-tRNA(Asn)/Glu-tRNA(Gln) amidotransferase A subunit family amidase
VSLPLLNGRSGLPVGIQLIGARNRDRKLLGVAGWLETVSKNISGSKHEFEQ